MASLWQKFTSGLDFWDKKENQAQREQYAREDEEERRRRAIRDIQPTVQASRPNPTENRPELPIFDPANPLKKVGSQSQSILGQSQVPQKSPPKTIQEAVAEKTTQQIDKLAAENLPQARKEAEQGEGWLGRNILNRKAIAERAKTIARSRATSQYQAQNDYKRNPVVADYGKETMRMAGEESERLKKNTEGLEKFENKLVKAGEIASYVPGAGAALNLGLAGAEKLAKATGNEAYGNDIEEQRLRVDLGMTQAEFDAIDPETQQKLRNLQSLGLVLSPLDFVGVGGVAESGVVAAGKTAFKESIDAGLKKAAKETAEAVVKRGAKDVAVPLALGTGASVGAQSYLGGTENIDLAEALKTGALTAGVSLGSPQGTKAATDDAVEDAARLSRSAAEVDETVDSPVKAAIEEGVPRKATTATGEAAIEVEAGIKSTNAAKAAPVAPPPQVPDVNNPIALAKAPDNAVAATDVPIANFAEPVDGSQPLQKLPEQQQLELAPPPTAEVAQAPEVDANGNPVLRSDAQRAQELAAEGIVPQRGDSMVAANEADLQAAAEQAAREQVSNPASLREREAFAATEEDPVLAQEILDSVPGKAPMNVEESLSIARTNARSQPPEQLVASWSGERVIDQNDPQAWVNALEERKVLNALVSEGVEGAREARLNLADAMSNFQSKSGQNLNILKAAYDELPSDMKTELLVKKINRARNKAGLDDLPNEEMEVLSLRVESADNAANRVKSIENEIADFNRGITSGSATPEARARLDELNAMKEEALTDLYTKNAIVTDYFAKASPDSSFGQKLANWNRVSMLSSVTGRAFDMASTAATTGLDTINRGVSALFARALNDRVGSGGALETLPKALPSIDEVKSAVGRTVESARGNNQVRDVMAEIQGMGTGRSELQNQSTGKFRNLVKAGTEAPTEVTRYIEDNQIYRQGRQAADELGLTGEDAELYADSYWSVASSNEKYLAQQEHLKSNMLQNNAVSSKIDAVSNVLVSGNSKVGQATGAILKSIVAPFTRFIGGMTHRTFTDMNVIYNAYEVRKAVKNGDTQMLSDALAKMTTNTAIGVATATVLAETGVLSETDANGDSYGGLYFHVGDRYIPVGFAGLASVPMIVGYGMNQAFDADSPVDAFTDVTTDTLSRVLASTGTAGFFGADNALQTAIGSASSAISPSETGANERDWMDVIGQTVRQGIPAIGADINAVINQIPGANPTGEAAETKVLNEDGTQNPAMTQLAKTQNTIPGLSQMLPRKDGVPARDLIDRATKGTRETDKMAEERQVSESLDDWKKRLEDEGVPVTYEKYNDLAKNGDYTTAIKGAEYRLAELEADEKASETSKANARRDIEEYKFGEQYGYVPQVSNMKGIESRLERGEYGAAAAGKEFLLNRLRNDENTPQSDIRRMENDIKRYKVYDELKLPPDVMTAYEKTDEDSGGVGVTNWRKMMESGDPELVAYAEQLYTLDKTLLDKGAVKKAKYYWLNGGRGGSGGRGGRGGGRGSSPKFVTDIATQNARSFTYSPIKAESASFSEPKSSIPKLQKVANNDTSKLKKISVKRGGRA